MVKKNNKFLVAFNKTNNNFSKSFLLNNPSMTISRYDTRPINFNFLTSSVPLIERQTVCQLRIDQIAFNGRLLSIDEITANTGLHINLLFYLRLHTAFHTSAYSTAGALKNGTRHDFFCLFRRKIIFYTKKTLYSMRRDMA